MWIDIKAKKKGGIDHTAVVSTVAWEANCQRSSRQAVFRRSEGCRCQKVLNNFPGTDGIPMDSVKTLKELDKTCMLSG